MTLPSAQDWLFSAKTFIASMLALYIALAVDLPRPYWAMAAVYIVSNPFVGATSSKALYRALGTLLGASAAVVAVPAFVNAPELLSVVVALWTGTLLYISLIDRGPRAYVFMLAGYTMPIIALPVVDSPAQVFDVALSRSEEIILGIVCASVVGSVLFPISVGKLLSQRIAAWLKDTAAWAEAILRGEGATPATPLARQKLAADTAGLDMVIAQLSYDPEARDTVRHARELRGRMLMLLPILSSLADRLHALKDEDGALPQPVAELLNAMVEWLAMPGDAREEGAAHLRERLSVLEPDAGSTDWGDLIFLSALARAREFIDLWQDCRALEGLIGQGANSAGWTPVYTRRRIPARVRHHDYALMTFQAGSAVLTTLAACALWIATGWSSGAGFVVMAAVAVSFFASLDRPAAMIAKMAVSGTASVFVAGAYLFAVLPMVHDFEMLALVFAVPFLILGTLMPRPENGMMMTLLVVNTATFVALQNRFSADFAGFANDGLATVLGMGFAWLTTLIVRPFGAELAARRLVRAGWNDLAETAGGLRRNGDEILAARMLDRLGQLVPRLASNDTKELPAVDGFAELRIGLNIVELQRQRDGVSRAAASAIGAVLDGVRDHFAARLQAGASEPPADLCARIDRALRAAPNEIFEHAQALTDALVGLRRALFPHAAPPAGGAPRGDTRMLIAAE